MKIRKQEIEMYICEICGKESIVHETIEKCEVRCSCKHEWVYSVYDYEDYSVTIVANCKRCKAKKKTREVSIDEDMPEKLARVLYEELEKQDAKEVHG